MVIPKPCPLISQNVPNPVHGGRVAVDISLLEQLFAMSIATVKSIPSSCRMAFAQALTVTMRRVVAAAGSIEAWVKLLPRCTLRVI